MRKIVGISQKIKRAWLDALLDRLVTTTDEVELRTFLDKHLKEELPGTESRAKSTGIILRIWSGIPPERVALRDRAVALLPRISGQERIWLHWGMTALAYPFFRDTSEIVGRLLALQDDFTTTQVQTRILATWGDRSTSKEAAQKLITTLVNWEVLRSTKTRGHFLLSRKMTTSSTDLQLWLLEALLGASVADEIEAQQLLRLPESFPFSISISVTELRRSDRFNIHRQGLDMDMVALHKVKLAPPPKLPKKPKKARAPRLVFSSLFDLGAKAVVSNDGKINTVPVVPVPIPPVDGMLNGIDRRRKIEEPAKNEVLRTRSDQETRFPQVRPLLNVPNSPFAAPLIECAKLFRDSHYFSCIALSQALLEAMIRHVWQIKLKKTTNQESSFEKKLAALHKKNLITEELKTKLKRLWDEPRSFYQLQPTVDADQHKLEESARDRLKMLNELEQTFFGITLQDGNVIPDNPEYWSTKTGESVVSMRVSAIM